MVCRTCLSSNDEYESVFVKKLVNAEYISVATMISACIGLEVSEYDSISCIICKTCIDFILVAFKYRKQCWKSHMELMAQLKMEYEKSCLESNIQEMLKAEICSDFEQTDDTLCCRPTTNDISLEDDGAVVQHRTVVRHRAKRVNENGLPHEYGDMFEYTKIVTDEVGKNKMYRCVICNFKYKRIGSLRTHQQKIHCLQFQNDYECIQCGKFCISQKRLNFHIRVHDASKYVCQFCGKKFRVKSALTTHVRRHVGDKPFGCDQCDFRTFTKSDLMTHKRSHTGEKPFKCYHCNAAFSTFSHRAAHVRQHSDERPYKCIICTTAYKTRGVYRSHMDTHDPKKSIVCEICKHVSSNRKNYMRHIKQHRPNNTTECNS